VLGLSCFQHRCFMTMRRQLASKYTRLRDGGESTCAFFPMIPSDDHSALRYVDMHIDTVSQVFPLSATSHCLLALYSYDMDDSTGTGFLSSSNTARSFTGVNLISLLRPSFPLTCRTSLQYSSTMAPESRKKTAEIPKACALCPD
jgi:hypothetical protein